MFLSAYVKTNNFVYTTHLFPPLWNALFVVTLVHYPCAWMGWKEAKPNPAARRLFLATAVIQLFSPCCVCRLSACWFAFVSPLTSVLWCQAKSFLSVNLLKILKPLCGLSVRVDFLFWELCFNVLAIFFFLPPPTSHTIAIFPSFLYLFSHPRFPEIVQRRRLYILFSYCDTWRAFCDYQFRSCRSSMLCVFLGGFIWEKCWKFSQLLFSICASVCVFCVVPHFHLTRNISSFFSLHVFHISMKKNKSFFVTEGEYVCGSMKGFLIEQR